MKIRDLLVGWLVILVCIGIMVVLSQLPALVLVGSLWGIITIVVLSYMAAEIGKTVRTMLEKTRNKTKGKPAQ